MGQINIINNAGTNKLSLSYNGTSDKTVDTTHLSNITSDVQTQLDSKLNKSGGAMTGRLTTELTSGGNTAKFVQVYNSTDTTGALQAVSAGAGGSGFDAAHWAMSDSNWASRWYGNAQRSASGNVSDAGSVFLGGMTSSGKLLLPLQPAFMAISNVTGNTGGSGNIVFGNAVVNVGNSYNASTGYFTAPIAGLYQFSAHTLSRSNSHSYTHFRKNNVNYVLCEDTGGTSSYRETSGTMMIYLAANDTVNIYSPANTYGSIYDWFCGHLIG